MYEMYKIYKIYEMYEHMLSIIHNNLFSTYDEVWAYVKRIHSTPAERIYLACAYPGRTLALPRPSCKPFFWAVVPVGWESWQADDTSHLDPEYASASPLGSLF